jgi:serine/threonine-protein kinase HipA
VRLLSAQLTMGGVPSPAVVRAYLDGLLPEGNARINAAMTAGVAPDDTYALVRAYGRDTPGAAIFVPEGTADPTRQGMYEPVTTAEVATRLRDADRHQPSSPDRTAESSTLPGMVPKIVLHRDGAQWYACKDGAPSTWILKRADKAGSPLADIVDTEVACLALARQVRLTTITAEILDLGDVRAIAVSRYDRQDVVGDTRIHQEDLAQALGLNTQDPNRKFQWGSRMPSLVAAADVLRLDGGNPDALLRLVTFSLLVGNTDLHAKNISFLRYPDGRVALSPAYDIAMHLHHPRTGPRRFAMDLDGAHLIEELTVEHVVAEGRRWGLSRRRADRVVIELADELEAAITELDPAGHPGVTPEAWDTVQARVTQAQALLQGRRTTDGRAGHSTAVTAVKRARGPRRR